MARGEQNPGYATALLNLAMWHEKSGRFPEALQLIRECVRIRAAVHGTASGEYFHALNNLACTLRMTGDYAAAGSFADLALAARTVYSEDHPLHTTVLIARALIAVGEGKPTHALALLRESAAIERRVLGRIFSVASDAQRLAYLDKVRERLSFVLSLARTHLPNDPAAVAEAYDLVLTRKALAAEAAALRRDAILGGRYPQLAARFRDLTTIRQQITVLTLAGPGPQGADVHHRLLAHWQQRQGAVEVELAGAVPEVGLEQRLLAADRRTVAAALPPGSALVEFVRFALFDFLANLARGEEKWKPARYLAFVLRPESPDVVRMVDLGEAEDIDRLVWAFRTDLLGGDAGGSRGMTLVEEALFISEVSPGAALRERIFDPLREAMAGAGHLVLAPDGELALVPFEVLPDSAGVPLVEDYLFSYLAVGRDVLRSEGGHRRPGEPLVIAAPDFDLGLRGTDLPTVQPEAGLVPRLCQPCATDAGRESALPLTADTAVAHGDPLDHPHIRPTTLSRDLPRSSLRFPPLPGTFTEGREVARLLGVEPVLGRAAVESRVKKAASPRVLHLATHGFFLPDQQEIPEGAFRGLAPENPLLRSGLALAGANTWLAGRTPPEEAEDGLLTAEDVTGLDLLGTELVVLSACETGLGQVRAGEGVFGLRRAFQLAGARSVVMSLWKVPDEPTRELMGALYRHLLAGLPRAEALRLAQRELRASYPHARDWGAFILQGDPGPLPPIPDEPEASATEGNDTAPEPPQPRVVYDVLDDFHFRDQERAGLLVGICLYVWLLALVFAAIFATDEFALGLFEVISIILVSISYWLVFARIILGWTLDQRWCRRCRQAGAYTTTEGAVIEYPTRVLGEPGGKKSRRGPQGFEVKFAIGYQTFTLSTDLVQGGFRLFGVPGIADYKEIIKAGALLRIMHRSGRILRIEALPPGTDVRSDPRPERSSRVGGWHASWIVRGLSVPLAMGIFVFWLLLIRYYPSRAVECVAFSSDGAWLMAGCSDKQARLYDVAELEQEHVGSWKLPDRPTSLACSPDGRRFIAWCEGGRSDPRTVVIVDARSGETLQSWPVSWRSRGGQTSWSPADDLVAWVDGQRADVADAATLTTRFAVPHSDWTTAAAFSPTGARLAVGGEMGRVYIWDLPGRGGAAKKHLVLTGPPAGAIHLAWSPDGARLAGGGGPEQRRAPSALHLWDVRMGKLLATIAEANVRGIAFSPDGQQLASVSQHGAVKLWNGHTGALEDDLTSLCKGGAGHGLAWSPQGFLAVAKGDLIVLDPSARKVIRRFRPMAD
jgi:hypothetical protein